MHLRFWEVVPCVESFPKSVCKLDLELICKSYEGLNL